MALKVPYGALPSNWLSFIYLCKRRGTHSFVSERRDLVGCIVGEAVRDGLKHPNMRINDDKRIDQSLVGRGPDQVNV
jgi:hypothetical protein